jgi:hypothetical protein
MILIKPLLYDIPFDPAKDLVAIAPTGRSAIFLATRAGTCAAGADEFVVPSQQSVWRGSVGRHSCWTDCMMLPCR